LNAEGKEYEVNGEDIILDSSYDSRYVLEKEYHKHELTDVSEYGFGFWARFLMVYPK
jgi:hypothetical protein